MVLGVSGDKDLQHLVRIIDSTIASRVTALDGINTLHSAKT
jgi:hypothetical protein